ncbi:uncharacterized protein Dvir_GJ12052 [Drosophila virilis]|uniref:Uncharacterized protein n=2 Tax=Drosophila virilis TaxID=7244 RepID=A0A0Q9WJZ8_DROVI|nr:uncharacterized protein LOC6628283 [Drosophila virilis]KRF81211.1 uncharacterized protein Dvir_GJ12052 [Drosophila virilis]
MLAMARAQLLICCLWLVLGSKYVHMSPCKEHGSHRKQDVDYQEDGQRRHGKTKELSIKIKVYQPENEHENPCHTNEESDCEQSENGENQQDNRNENQQENQLENQPQNQNPEQLNDFLWIFKYISHWQLPLPTYTNSQVSSLRIETSTGTPDNSGESQPKATAIPPAYGGCLAFCP